jgi:hypothetical protein
MALLEALQNLLRPQIEQATALNNNAVAPVQANVPQGRPMQTLPDISRAPYEQQNGFEPMQPGGGRFKTEEDSTFWNPETGTFEPKPEEPWYKRAMNDPALMARLAMGFNTMRLNPDQGLNAMLGDRIKTAGELAKGNKTAQAVIVQLRNMGENEAADMVAAQPAIAKDVLKQIVQAKYAKSASPTASGVQIDPNNGQMYQVVFDPSTGENKRVNVEGAMGETPSAIANREASAQLKMAGMKMASEKGAAVFGRASGLGEQIGKLTRARDLVKEGGAQTGVIRSLLPSFNSATAELRAIANGLGIDIINSATFGALSEKELSLALSTGLDTSLSGAALQEHIQDKINAQEKLYNQLMQDARELSSGITYNEYIQRRTSKRRESPIPSYGGGVQLPPELQSQMTPEQIAAFKRLSPDMQEKFIGGQ